MISRISILISSVLILSSCSTTKWIHDNKSPEMYDYDMANCKDWAFEKYPTELQDKKVTEYRDISSSITPSYSTTFTIPYNTIKTVDVNSEARENAVKSCMMHNGWRLVKN